MNLLSQYRKAQKEVETTNYTLSDLMNEGKAKEAGLKEEDIDQKELEAGIQVEMEHTSNVDVAKKIAMDHLAEFPQYYTELKKMEDGLKKTSSKE